MRPSEAMGLFVRTWRSQWARLSREQLAITLSAHSSRPGAVTTNVLRQWEHGQPPGSLEALCLIMRGHAVSQPELAQFRDAVLAACLDRHYEGLFAEEDFAQRPDCDALAYEALNTEWHVQMGGTNTISLVAWCHELQRAAAERPCCAAPNGQAGRQDLALAWALHALAKNHFARGRFVESSRVSGECVRVMETRLGRDAGALCSEHLLQFHAATNLSCLGRTQDALSQLLALAEQRRAAGDRRWSHGNLMWAVYPACALGASEVLQLLRSHEPELIAYADGCGEEWLQVLTHRALYSLDLGQAQLTEAEARLADEVLPYERTPTDQAANCQVRAVLAQMRGDHAEAQTCLERALSLATSLGLEAQAHDLRGRLAACERAQHRERHCGKGQIISSQCATP